MTMNDVTWMILRVAITVLMTAITRYVIPVLKMHLESRKNDVIFDLIATAVRAAEQTIDGSGKGSVKKEQVVVLVTKWLKEKGITISADRLDQLIEECVYLVKNNNS